jgi:hypothetical protein
MRFTGTHTPANALYAALWRAIDRMYKRPLAVTLVGLLYILVGVVGGAYHLMGFKVQHPFQYDILWAEGTELVAILCGVYMLRGHNWARWLAMAWIAFHVILSALGMLPGLAIHGLFSVILAYLLFRPTSGRYFRAATAKGES